MFTKEEIWENYTYFIKQVAPVAEEAGVRIGIHPDDPPVPVLAGVPRCIFSNFDGYKRALEIANSPNVGICLCCGTWLEGGRQLTGKDPEEMIRYFGAEKIWKIHFRNVSAPLPHFVETFMDNGYYDMYKIMKALRDVNFDGIVILDHSPRMVGGNYADGLWLRLHEQLFEPRECRSLSDKARHTMRKLQAFRPEGVEGLEGRLVLSHPTAAGAVLHAAAVQVARDGRRHTRSRRIRRRTSSHHRGSGGKHHDSRHHPPGIQSQRAPGHLDHRHQRLADRPRPCGPVPRLGAARAGC